MSGLVALEPIPASSHSFSVNSFADAEKLARALRRSIAGEVRFDRGSRAIYATDASNYRQIPIGIVLPRSKEDVLATIAACREYKAPVLSRGGGTSLAGQCCNVAVMLDFSKYMHRLIELNAEEKYARVEPGIVLDTLRRQAEKHGLTFGPDPATHNHCTLGGMLGNNSCGTHAQMAGKTEDNTLELDIVLYDGTRMTVGETGNEELDRIVREGTRKGQISMPNSNPCETGTERLFGSDTLIFPAASPGTTSRSFLPKTTSTLPRRWWEPRAPVSPSLKRSYG